MADYGFHLPAMPEREGPQERPDRWVVPLITITR